MAIAEATVMSSMSSLVSSDDQPSEPWRPWRGTTRLQWPPKTIRSNRGLRKSVAGRDFALPGNMKSVWIVKLRILRDFYGYQYLHKSIYDYMYLCVTE